MAKAQRDDQQKGSLTMTLKVSDMPEVLADLRLELARLLKAESARHWSEGEQNIVDMAVRDALVRVAHVFEAGLTDPADVEET